MEEDIDVAVIGAGLSGLTTGLRLHQSGQNIHIFEARPRVGGRVHSVTVDTLNKTPSIAELGGQVLTDGGDYPYIKALIKEFDLKERTYTLNFSRRFYDGQTFHDPHALLKRWMCHHYPTLHAFKSAFQKACLVANTLKDVLNILLGDNDSLLKNILTLQCQAYEGGTLEILSVRHHGATLYEMMKGGLASPYAEKGIEHHLHIPCSSVLGGNMKLPEAMATPIRDKISLSHILKRVEARDSGGITCVFEVHNETRIVHCHKLIFTIPCTLFASLYIDPTLLRPSRLQLFEKVAYGQHGKIIVPVDKKCASSPSLMMEGMGTFLNPTHDLLTLYYVGHYGATLKTHAKEYYKKARSLVTKAIPNEHLTSHSPCLAKDEINHYAHAPITKDWANDPFSRGSYSAFSKSLDGIHDAIVSYKGIDVRKLFIPENDTLFFAGEHTSIIPEIGTMEAAVESGERIAQCLLALRP